MEIFKYVVAHKYRSSVFKAPGGGFYYKVRSAAGGESDVQLRGYTKDLREVFWSKYVPQFVVVPAAADHRSPAARKSRQVVGGGVYTSVISSYTSQKTASKHNAKKKAKSGKSWHSRMIEGLRLGTRVHGELHAFTSIMNFSVHGFRDSQIRLRSVEDSLSENGGSGTVHPCTAEILRAMRDDWKWYPVAAEWCVGDISRRFKYATQIDMLALKTPTASASAPATSPKRDRLILCEVKTGYNDGMFFRGSGPVEHLEPVMSNAPVNQAKIQLVLSAAMFCDTFQLTWENIDLYVIWCPSRGDKIRAERCKVTEQERVAILKALKAKQFV